MIFILLFKLISGPSPKVLDFNEKNAWLGIHSPCWKSTTKIGTMIASNIAPKSNVKNNVKNYTENTAKMMSKMMSKIMSKLTWTHCNRLPQSRWNYVPHFEKKKGDVLDFNEKRLHRKSIVRDENQPQNIYVLVTLTLPRTSPSSFSKCRT